MAEDPRARPLRRRNCRGSGCSEWFEDQARWGKGQGPETGGIVRDTNTCSWRYRILTVLCYFTRSFTARISFREDRTWRQLKKSLLKEQQKKPLWELEQVPISLWWTTIKLCQMHGLKTLLRHVFIKLRPWEELSRWEDLACSQECWENVCVFRHRLQWDCSLGRRRLDPDHAGCGRVCCRYQSRPVLSLKSALKSSHGSSRELPWRAQEWMSRELLAAGAVIQAGNKAAVLGLEMYFGGSPRTYWWMEFVGWRKEKNQKRDLDVVLNMAEECLGERGFGSGIGKKYSTSSVPGTV